MIDNRAIIDSTAKIANGVSIGPFSIIGPHVEIGEGTEIGSHVIITKNTRLGKNNKIHSFAALGGDPQHTHYKGEETYLELGDNNLVREFSSLHRGTTQGNGVTKIGNRNFFMAYSHVAHDCVVGNENIFMNNASIAGHVIVENGVGIGAFCGVHQNVRIGSYSYLGHATKVGQDIPAYVMVTGVPGGPRGLNLVGLKRRGFSEQTIRKIRRAYDIVYKQGLPLQEAISQLEAMLTECPELETFLVVLKETKRGIARKTDTG
jgi:UDP-N-acetylglucosamine acyltransferase